MPPIEFQQYTESLFETFCSSSSRDLFSCSAHSAFAQWCLGVLHYDSALLLVESYSQNCWLPLTPGALGAASRSPHQGLFFKTNANLGELFMKKIVHAAGGAVITFKCELLKNCTKYKSSAQRIQHPSLKGKKSKLYHKDQVVA